MWVTIVWIRQFVEPLAMGPGFIASALISALMAFWSPFLVEGYLASYRGKGLGSASRVLQCDVTDFVDSP